MSHAVIWMVVNWVDAISADHQCAGAYELFNRVPAGERLLLVSVFGFVFIVQFLLIPVHVVLDVINDGPL